MVTAENVDSLIKEKALRLANITGNLLDLEKQRIDLAKQLLDVDKEIGDLNKKQEERPQASKAKTK